jgi:hypothetical protein
MEVYTNVEEEGFDDNEYSDHLRRKASRRHKLAELEDGIHEDPQDYPSDDDEGISGMDCIDDEDDEDFFMARFFNLERRKFNHLLDEVSSASSRFNDVADGISVGPDALLRNLAYRLTSDVRDLITDWQALESLAEQAFEEFEISLYNEEHPEEEEEEEDAEENNEEDDYDNDISSVRKHFETLFFGIVGKLKEVLEEAIIEGEMIVSDRERLSERQEQLAGPKYRRLIVCAIDRMRSKHGPEVVRKAIYEQIVEEAFDLLESKSKVLLLGNDEDSAVRRMRDITDEDFSEVVRIAAHRVMKLDAAQQLAYERGLALACSERMVRHLADDPELKITTHEKAIANACAAVEADMLRVEQSILPRRTAHYFREREVKKAEERRLAAILDAEKRYIQRRTEDNISMPPTLLIKRLRIGSDSRRYELSANTIQDFVDLLMGFIGSVAYIARGADCGRAEYLRHRDFSSCTSQEAMMNLLMDFVSGYPAQVWVCLGFSEMKDAEMLSLLDRLSAVSDYSGIPKSGIVALMQAECPDLYDRVTALIERATDGVELVNELERVLTL